MLQPGTYTAKLLSYGITQTQAGLPQLKCTFGVEGEEKLSWFGSFKEGGAQANTIKTLLTVLDLYAEPSEVENYLAQIAEEGESSGLLNQDKDYSIVVEHDTYNGKTSAKIKWVNNPGGAQKFERLAKTEAKKLFTGMNLSGNVAAFQAANPGITKKAAVVKKDDLLF